MLVRVICKDGSCGSMEDYDLNDFIRTGNVATFFCQHSNEWVDVAYGCEIYKIRYLMPTGNFHTCFLQQNYKDD
jgi:hypothetical protein